MIAYEEVEAEIVKHRNSGKVDIEEFLEHKATAKHTEIVNKLRMNDNKMNTYHQVREQSAFSCLYQLYAFQHPLMGRKSTKM